MSAKIISEKEQKQIFKAIELGNHSDRNRLIFCFGLYSGLRSIELCNLQVADILDEANNVREVVYLKADKVKGNKANRIYISDKLGDERN